MAYSKIILNGETLMDVTSDTVVAEAMTSGTTATKNDGTKITGTIVTKSAADLTASGSTVTVPSGYYSAQATKNVASTTHPNPTAAIASSTGVVTATHTQTAGYVAAGTTTGTLSLTTQAGKTVTPTEAAQTAVASYRWTTGTVSVAAISSTYVGTGVTTRSAADMTVAAQSVTAPAGYYSQAFTKAVTTTTHPNPTATFVSSTGVFTATHAQTVGYVAAGTTTSTYNLTTQAAATYNTSTADQTVASYRWLTGTQTIKSVTTSNLTAANIASGVVVKVGDANNASRITQVTGTYSGAASYYEVYRSMTNNSQLNYNITSFSDFISKLSYVRTSQFQGKTFSSGSYLFYVADYIADGAFAQISTFTTPYSDGEYSFNFPICSYMGQFIFFNNCYITNVSLPACSNIGYRAFERCYNLKSAIFPSVDMRIASSGFAYCSRLSIASFPLCPEISSDAFRECSSLTTISFPKVSNIGAYAFTSCYNLTALNFPSCSGLGAGAFQSCTKITTISFPLCQSIGAYAFSQCYSLTSAIFPEVTYVGAYAFKSCSSLTTISFPKVSRIGDYAFTNCSSITQGIFPSCGSLADGCFYQCSNISIISLPICSFFSYSDFKNCYKLISLYLNSVSSVPTFGNNMFSSTPIEGYSTVAGRYGSIYVPSSLFDSFKTATGWTAYSARMVSV